MKDKLEKYIENFVDKTNPKAIDIVSVAIFLVNAILTTYFFISFLFIIKTPIIANHSPFIYSFIISTSLILFYLSMLGEKLNKPVNRPKVFFAITVVLAISTYTMLAEIFNYCITDILDSLIQVSEIPQFLIHTNVRLITVFLPLLIVVLTFSKSFKIPFVQEYKNELLEYQADLFTRNVDKITDYTVDVNICEDIKTAKPVIVSEKLTFRHKLLSGSSGSGKTALSIRPDLAQLFYKKAFFREKLKEKAFKALEDGLCYINKPITNEYFNRNFSMDYISIKEDKKEEFMELFKDLIVGVRKSQIRLYSNTHELKDHKAQIEVPIKSHEGTVGDITIDIMAYSNGMVKSKVKFDLKEDIINSSENDYNIVIHKKSYVRKNIDGEEEFYEKDGANEYLDIVITSDNDYKFAITVDEKGDGKIIYKNVGITVIAPDGGLAKDTTEIAASNGIDVFKLDPKMEEIEKGCVSKFNPLLVGNPEKAGDIISSILVAMEQTGGKDTNPYFTNASIRAIRNLIILLRVMYPKLNNGENPILTDVLTILNNFNLVKPYVEKMKQDTYLANRWKSVIDYFETSFYPPVLDENNKPVKGSHIGTKTKKTEEAIGGITNQLDNFLGREEIKFIFCNRTDSLDLSKVLENGDCLAISTRQSELGDVLGKAFALMIILSIQNAVLGRYSEDENPEIPYHLFIDEFPFYINDQTKVFFTFSRKYKCACTVAVQNLSQLEEVSKTFREVIFTNCTTKLVLPGANVEDREYFCKFFGIEEQFDLQTSINSNPIITENAKYSESMRGGLKDKDKVSQQELSELKFKRCYYATVDPKGNNVVGKGYMDFLKLTDNNTLKVSNFDFEKYNFVRSTNDIKSSENVSTIKKKNTTNNTTKKETNNTTIKPSPILVKNITVGYKSKDGLFIGNDDDISMEDEVFNNETAYEETETDKLDKNINDAAPNDEEEEVVEEEVVEEEVVEEEVVEEEVIYDDDNNDIDDINEYSFSNGNESLDDASLDFDKK